MRTRSVAADGLDGIDGAGAEHADMTKPAASKMRGPDRIMRWLQPSLSDGLIGDGHVMPRVAIQVGALSICQDFAHPGPNAMTPNHPAVPRRQTRDHPPAGNKFGPGIAKHQLALAKYERLAVHEHFACHYLRDLAPPHAALAERLHRTVHFANSAMDIQYVEGMVRTGTCWRLTQHQVTCAALKLVAEALEQGVVELPNLDIVQQLVAEPVGLDDPRVKRVADAVARPMSCRYGSAPVKRRRSGASPPSANPAIP
jgi:hypothetical protein